MLNETHAGLYILDVSGHGVAAALMAMTVIHLLSADRVNSALFEPVPDQNHSYRILEPGSVLTRLNKQFPMDDINGQYFTCIYAILDLETMTLCYASAGHPGPVRIAREGEAEMFGSTGMPIGFMPDSAYTEATLHLNSGDRVYFYSDGIPEVCNKYDEQFGLERLMRTLESNRYGRSSLKGSIDRLAVAALKWNRMAPLSDDASVIGIEVTPDSKP